MAIMGGNGQFGGRLAERGPSSPGGPRRQVEGEVLGASQDGEVKLYVPRQPLKGRASAITPSEAPLKRRADSPPLEAPPHEILSSLPSAGGPPFGAAPLSPPPSATPRDVAAQVLQALPPDVQAALLEIVQGSAARKPEGAQGGQAAQLESTVCTPEGEADCGE